jgi:hypothetical protein
LTTTSKNSASRLVSSIGFYEEQNNCVHIHFHNLFKIMQLTRYARACSTYDQFLIPDKLLIKQVDVKGVSTVSFTGSIP